MFRTTPLLGIAAFAALALTACSPDDAPPIHEAALSDMPPPAAVIPGTPAELRAEYAALQQGLSRLQQQALQDSAVAKQLAALEEEVNRRMTAADPTVPGKIDRLDHIQAEVNAAQAAGDSEKIQALVQEGTNLQLELRQLRGQTLADEEMEPRMEAVRTAVLAKMTELDPDAQKNMDRANAISAQLRADAPPGGPPAP